MRCRSSSPRSTGSIFISFMSARSIPTRFRHHHAWLAGIGVRAAQDHRSADGSDRPWRTAEDAFDVVIPSMPGYGFSGKPTATGWGPDHIARIWAELMQRLGYTRYVAQGGDWGSPVSSAMARQAPAGLLGIHINLPAVVPPEIAAIARRRRARRRQDSPRRNARRSTRSARPPKWGTGPTP